ncbi:MAG: hypothetical protein ACI9LO_000496 [Planctomycetota bacterium]|jgi:hypothetical protein
MKSFAGLSGLWCFAIMGKETWAGVMRRNLSAMQPDLNPILKELSHVTSSQQIPLQS